MNRFNISILIFLVCSISSNNASWGIFGGKKTTKKPSVKSPIANLQNTICPFFRKECSTIDERYKCQRAGCTAIPFDGIDNPENVKILDLRKNLLKKIPNMETLPNLEVLRLDHNSITEIEERAFDQNTKLIEVYLSYNKLTQIGKRLFRKVKDLRVLRIQNNRLKTLISENFAFVFNSRLEELFLSNNEIERVEEDAFTDLPKLRILHLSHNPLKNINENYFLGLDSLEELMMTNVSLTNIPPGLFKHLHDLKRLDLSKNRLRVITPNCFDKLPSLQRLNLNNNPISHLRDGVLGRLGSLETLLLDELRIAEISENFLNGQTLKSIRRISISFNQRLQRITRWSLAKMSDVNIQMSRNPKLSRIEDGAFGYDMNRSRVSSLNINNNDLSTIPEKLLDWSLLRHLDISDNRWDCNCKIKFLKRVISNYPEMSHRVRCTYPIHLRGSPMQEVSEFTCSRQPIRRMMRTILIIIITVGFIFCTGFLFWKKKETLLGCCFAREKTGYTRVTLNGITKSDEKIEPVNV